MDDFGFMVNSSTGMWLDSQAVGSPSKVHGRAHKLIGVEFRPRLGWGAGRVRFTESLQRTK